MSNNVKLPISVFIITKNEADRVADAILSVKEFVDEVIVVDSGSSDDTVNISKKHGAKTMFNEWPGYGQQKFFAEGKCRNDWILKIDADERISSELKEEIIELFKSKKDKEYVGFWMRIAGVPHYMPDTEIYAQSKYYLRLYNKKFCSYRQNAVHDSVVTSHTNLLKLKHIVRHQSLRSYSHAVEKLNFYSSCLAEEAYGRGKNVSNIKIIFTPLLAFMKHYFLRKYFLYGVEGFVESWVYSFSRLLKYAKIRECYRNSKRKQK